MVSAPCVPDKGLFVEPAPLVPRKRNFIMDIKIIGAYFSLFLTIMTAGIVCGRMKRRMDEHSEIITDLKRMKLLTEESYEMRNRENILRLDNLSEAIDRMRQASEKEREALKAYQLSNAAAMARIERESLLRCTAQNPNP